ncbi:protein mono-ADP-ribosyltransferase Parp16-like [Teleopsis dalmanni]|uniref:protein mono-ADP-ribosyltransferase Parp16-like n=1 Tax=Teleopsis dalmanni TaxID=139649 RepID=UPI0018CFE21B|nr:protein mono-ADP-ribosyltransferase Parp16-like [Teleopsis dalmanni]
MVPGNPVHDDDDVDYAGSTSSADEYSSRSDEESDPPEQTSEKLNELKLIFDLDFVGCEAKWSLFVAAAVNYRWEELLHPIPHRYKGNTIEHIERLLRTISETPKLSILYECAIQKDYAACNPYVVEVLHWLLLTMVEPAFRLINAEEFEMIINTFDLTVSGQSPTHVFQTCVDAHSEEECTFRNISSNFCCKYALWGAALYKFYSILFNGFRAEKSENEYIHLTTDLSQSLTHSIAEPCWGRSSCGIVLRCVGLCEYVEHPDFVKFRKDPNQKYTNVFVKNGEMIRLRYIIFFGEKLPSLPSVADSEVVDAIVSVSPLKYKNEKKCLAIGCYAAAAISLGFMYQHNTLGLKAFMDHKLNQMLQKLLI